MAIAVGQGDATDVELAGNAKRDGLEVCVQHVHLRIGNRIPNGDCVALALSLAGPGGHIHGRLGWAVEVV